MIDPQHVDLLGALVDLVDDLIRPSPIDPEAFEGSSESVSHPGWILEQRTQHELDDGGGHLLRQSSQAPLRRGSDDDPPPGVTPYSGSEPSAPPQAFPCHRRCPDRWALISASGSVSLMTRILVTSPGSQRQEPTTTAAPLGAAALIVLRCFSREARRCEPPRPPGWGSAVADVRDAVMVQRGARTPVFGRARGSRPRRPAKAPARAEALAEHDRGPEPQRRRVVDAAALGSGRRIR